MPAHSFSCDDELDDDSTVGEDDEFEDDADVVDCTPLLPLRGPRGLGPSNVSSRSKRSQS